MLSLRLCSHSKETQNLDYQPVQPLEGGMTTNMLKCQLILNESLFEKTKCFLSDIGKDTALIVLHQEDRHRYVFLSENYNSRSLISNFIVYLIIIYI